MSPHGLHRIALFLPSCSLLGLYTFRFCLTACLFCLPAYFLRSTGGILALPFFSPRFIGTPLFRRGGFCQSRLTALVCGKELLRVDQFLAMQDAVLHKAVPSVFAGPFRALRRPAEHMAPERKV